MLKFYVEVFRTSLFQNAMMDLVHVWNGDRYWSNILHSTIRTPIHDLKVKVTDLELFRTSIFPNPMIDLVRVWYDDGFRSKMLHTIIPYSIHDLKVKVTDLLHFC